ncbi:NADH:flavin oxidoreductase [Alicyclobacillus fastidiosus]|uniref:NADH:flavin oxidoreductase n=1 Tax=Alicyclobacillus fastidiosus TaxID=392011 RepID=A0ABY6ZNQ8_9BACL|nr:NADH:flavin oxidoreductase [Alicyclobacillus fastidiosus]WAH44484.1 NADH:flavin oxidoreductase [Alicyclobacillus fastidiosus]GMA64252.1 NADH:flavin oxidoreductase [Alicyclobacillus fastidiosus]
MSTTTHIKHPELFKSIRIGHVELSNRIVLAPMTRTSASEDGLATDRMVKYYARFAKGGFGLLITEGIYPDEIYSQGYFGQPGLANDDQVLAWSKVTAAVHENGARIFAQLMHAGAISQGNMYKDVAIGPSAVQPKGTKLEMYGGSGAFSVPKETTKKDIQQVIQGFVDAALRARQAGFDGVEIHGANGYILDQFLTDYMNQRTDEYGGSTENRMRLLVEVSQAVRQAVGQDFVVGIRISQGKVNDFTHKWANGEKDAEVIFKSLGEAGLDYIHTTEYYANKPAFGEGPTLAELAKRYGNIIVIANGNLDDPTEAENMIVSKRADLIALGKAALANRDWPNRVAQNEALDAFDGSVLQPTAVVKDVEL